MFPHKDSRKTMILFGIFFLIIAVYAFFELRGLIFGPVLKISSEVTESHEQFILVSGRAERIVTLAMNGKEITVTENGDFSEPYLLARGLNRIVFDAKDTYGHTTSDVVEIMYRPMQANLGIGSPTNTESGSVGSAETSSTNLQQNSITPSKSVEDQ